MRFDLLEGSSAQSTGWYIKQLESLEAGLTSSWVPLRRVPGSILTSSFTWPANMRMWVGQTWDCERVLDEKLEEILKQMISSRILGGSFCICQLSVRVPFGCVS